MSFDSNVHAFNSNVIIRNFDDLATLCSKRNKTELTTQRKPVLLKSKVTIPIACQSVIIPNRLSTFKYHLGNSGKTLCVLALCIAFMTTDINLSQNINQQQA